MTKDRFISIITPLIQDLTNLPKLLSEIKHETGMVMACMSCDFLPFEILHACGIHPFIFPHGLEQFTNLQIVPDVVIAPKRCCALTNVNNTIPIITVDDIPAEYGDSSLHAWNTLIADVLEKIKGKPFEISPEELRLSAERYAALRRLVRGITLLRREKPDALSNEELQAVFSASLIFPPEMATLKLSQLLDALNDYSFQSQGNPIPALVYGRCYNEGTLLNDLEKAGFLVAEDDTCCGRRCFDLSYNTASENLLDEIINAFSFRPFCPCLRNAASRFELLYMLAGSFGIETVIFIDDGFCPSRTAHIEFMRPRLMRLGIDPLLLHPENALSEAKKYVNLASR